MLSTIRWLQQGFSYWVDELCPGGLVIWNGLLCSFFPAIHGFLLRFSISFDGRSSAFFFSAFCAVARCLRALLLVLFLLPPICSSLATLHFTLVSRVPALSILLWTGGFNAGDLVVSDLGSTQSLSLSSPSGILLWLIDWIDCFTENFIAVYFIYKSFDYHLFSLKAFFFFSP